MSSGENRWTERLPAATVLRIERAVGSDPVTEERVLRFIADRNDARNLFYLPARVAAQVNEEAGGFRSRGETILPAGAVLNAKRMGGQVREGTMNRRKTRIAGMWFVNGEF